MTEYVTTNIRLPKAMHERVKRLALEENKSMAQVVRESVVHYLTEPATETLEREQSDELLEAWKDDSVWLLGQDQIKADVTDGSINHDLYLYGPRSDSA